MNKIKITTDKVDIISSDKNIIINDNIESGIIKLDIKVLDDTTIDIECNGDDIKIDSKIEVSKEKNVIINEIKQNKKIKIQNKYYLEENSKITIDKFYDAEKVKELDIIYLNGEEASANYNFKTIGKDKQNYDIVVYHNHHKTKSNIDNKGITIAKGSLSINVTSIIYNGIKKCVLNQNNRIINMNNNESKISPNLLIEENDVIANHSAYIGGFKDEVLFYLMSRGISKVDATKLLIRSFLNGNNEKIDEIINKYWR